MTRVLLGMLVAAAAVTSVAEARYPLLLEHDYGNVQANRPSQTGLYRVRGAIVYTDKIRIVTSGQHCNLDITAVEYTRFNGDYTRPAQPAGGNDYTIPDARVSAINVRFTQRQWTNIECGIKIYSLHAQDPTLLTFNYSRVRAYTPYSTGLYRIDDGPVRTGKIRVATLGTYCSLAITSVEYTRYSGDYTWPAYPARDGNGGWTIPDGVVHALKVGFEQSRWTNVDCELKIYDAN